jgi:hypothetical protein
MGIHKMVSKKIVNNVKHQEVTTASHYRGLPIMAGDDYPCFLSTLEKFYRELSLICARYSRVVLVRVDLHPSSEGGLHPHEIDISGFSKSIVRKLERKFNSKVAYGWVKEIGRKEHNDGWHWHWWFAVKCDGKMKAHSQQASMLVDIITTWQEKVGGVCDRNHMAGWFYLRRQDFELAERLKNQDQIANGERPKNQSQIANGGREEKDILFNRQVVLSRKLNRNKVLGGVVDECFYALSYMTKIYSKVVTEHSKGDRLFATSNLNTKDRKSGRSEAIEIELIKIHEWLLKPVDPISISQKHIDEYEARKAEKEKQKADWAKELELQRLEEEEWG